jgi:Protein of unknown function (DUF3892)
MYEVRSAAVSVTRGHRGADEEYLEMAKWADYLISAVRYNNAESHIDAVQYREDLGEKAGKLLQAARTDIVSMIGEGKSFMTVMHDDKDELIRGAAVQVIEIDGVEYIKTVADNTKVDNLGDLPRF